MSTINSNGTMVFGNDSGGSVTIAPKNDTATNYTLSIPDVTAQVAVGRANDSAVMTALNSTGSAPIYACRAWINFNGTGTISIRASGNVSSITDNGQGDYTVNFTTAMSDINYSLSGTATILTAGNYIWGVCPQNDIANYSTGSIRFKVKEASSATPTDSPIISISIFR